MHEVVDVSVLDDNPLFRHLDELVVTLDLDLKDFVIFGSGPLFVHGLRQRINDLDIVARGTVWKRVAARGRPAIGTINGAPLAVFQEGQVQFSQGWIADDWDADTLIDNAELIHGLPFARLTDVLEYKLALRRPKDLQDIRNIEALLSSCPKSTGNQSGVEPSDSGSEGHGQNS